MRIYFDGYAVHSAQVRESPKAICFFVNAHGIENNREAAYYTALARGELRGYGFRNEENQKPESCYFNNMILRDLRALEYARSLPEWNRKEIYLIGGSQGAAIFNAAVPAALKRLQGRRRFQLLHLAGPGKLEATKQAYGEVSFPLLLLESSGRMELFLGAADLVVCRSGGSTVAELARFGKASVLIPYPFAAEHHQDDNARVLERAGGAELLPNAECSPERLEALFDRLLAAPETLAGLGRGAAACAVPDAAGRLIAELTNRLREQP